MMTSHAQYIEQNESISKLFLGLEKSRSKNKSITTLILDDNTSTNDASKILLEQHQFYSTLYNNTIDYSNDPK